ncbi:hypothetical protein LXL04_038575 [Taraxacum kok-saghyz]
MGEENFSAKIPQFDGADYDHWSGLMENLLRAKGLYNMIEEGFDEPRARALATLTDAQRNQLEEKRQKDHKVKHYLFRAIDRTVFEQILDRRNSTIVWDSLKTKYGGNERVKRIMLNALRRDFEVL